MARQNIELGTPPTGVGGDTPRSANIKINAMFTELYKLTQGELTSLNAVDIQTITTPGSYYITNGVNRPTGAGNGYLFVTALSGANEVYHRFVNVNLEGTWDQVKLSGTWRGWNPLVYGEKVSSAEDAVAGKILTVGYSGRNGGVAIVKGAGTVISDLKAAALFACNSSYTGAPSWMANGAIFVENDVHGFGAAGYALQRIRSIVDPKLTAVRALVNGTYTEWDLEKPLTLSNANGTYTMYPGGALDFWKSPVDATAFTPAANRQNISWTFPIACVGDRPVISCNGAARLGGVIASSTWQVYAQTLSSATCAIQRPDGLNIDDARDISWSGKGRWRL